MFEDKCKWIIIKTNINNEHVKKYVHDEKQSR